MINRSKMPRQLRAQGGITNVTPREGFFLGGIKKRIRKLIPNEIADIAVKAAPFVAPFQPGIAAAMRGIGRFDQRGSISDALKQGALTYGFGKGARFLAGAEGPAGGFSTFTKEGFKQGPIGRLFQNPLTEGNPNFTGGDANKGKLLGTSSTPATTEKGVGFIKDAAKKLDNIPIIGELPNMVKQQILIGGVSGAATYIYEAFLKEEPPQQEGETYEEYMARRKENVGRKMKGYFDNYFKFDKDYSSMTDEQKQAFIDRVNVKDGGRIGYQTGGITMGRTLQQNVAANRQQATNIQAMLNAARAKAGLPTVQAPQQTAPSGISSLSTPAQTSAPAPSITKTVKPISTSTQMIGAPMGARQSTQAPTMQQITSAMLSSGNPMASSGSSVMPQTISSQMMGPNVIGPGLPGNFGGLTIEQFDKLPQAQQDKIMDAERVKSDQQAFRQSPIYEQTRMEPQTQLKILQERGVDTSTLYNQQGDLDVDKFVLTRLKSDLQEAGVQLTGNETPFELLELEEEEKRKIIKEMSEKPMFDPYSAYDRLTYTGPTDFQLSGGVASPMATGGRAGRKKNAKGGMPTGIMKTNKAGVMERDYRDKGGFVPVGIKEKADDVPAMLSKNEFVMTANAVRGAGGGSIEKGAQRMYDTMKKLEKRVV